MIVLATFFVMLSQSWIGVWDLQIPEAVEPEAHLVIHSEDEVELYNPNWYPYIIIFSRFEDEAFEVHATFESRGDIFVLKGERRHDRVSGRAEYRGQLPQYTLQQEMTGERTFSKPVPPPHKWIQSLTGGEVIDVVEGVLEKAQNRSLALFQEAWNGEFGQRFYYLLREWATDSSDFTERLHQALNDAAEWKRPENTAVILEDADADYLVLMPSVTEREPLLIELPTAVNEFPGGREPCCGEDRFRMEKFLLYPVTPTRTR